MKKNSMFPILAIMLALPVLFILACEKKKAPEPSPAPVPQACTYTQWAGSGSCSNSGYFPVSNDRCCPAGSPYWVEGGSCYKTCEAAHSAAAGATVFRYNDGTGGTGGTTTGGSTTGGSTTGGSSTGGSTTGGTQCNYTQWSGTNNCEQGYYPVSNTRCCPAGSPYSFEGAGYCYTSCQDAVEAANGKQVYRYNDGSSGGTTTGGSTTGGSTTGGSTTGGGGGTTYALFYTDNCNNGNIDIYVNNNYAGTISSCYPDGPPDCTQYNGAVRVAVSGTNNTWYGKAENSNKTWTGSVTLTADCNLLKLN